MSEQQAIILSNYRRVVDTLQGREFFEVDEDGVLRRWHPPTREVLEGEG